MKKHIIWIVLCIAVAAITRLVPHPPNFAPITAMGLLGAAYLHPRWMALVVPFVALFLSDLYLNNVVFAEYFQGFTLITSTWIYVAFALVILLGGQILQKVTPLRLLGASLTGSVLFFLITNFECMLSMPIYSKNLSGLMQSYIAGLPFLANSIAGDLYFSFLFFAVVETVRSMGVARQLAFLDGK